MFILRLTVEMVEAFFELVPFPLPAAPWRFQAERQNIIRESEIERFAQVAPGDVEEISSPPKNETDGMTITYDMNAVDRRRKEEEAMAYEAAARAEQVFSA